VVEYGDLLIAWRPDVGAHLSLLSVFFPDTA
jgi:hypothetical protein